MTVGTLNEFLLTDGETTALQTSLDRFRFY